MDGWEGNVWDEALSEGSWRLVRFGSRSEVGWEANCEGL